MTVRSIGDLAASVRGRRKDLRMTQADLARRSGVSRKWIYEFEVGKPTAELSLLLRVLDELGLALALDLASNLDTAAPRGADTFDLDVLLEEHRGR